MAKKTLREYMDQNEFFYVPEIYDCISTRAAEMNGFQMVMISSSDFACSQTGIPDLNLLSVDEYCHMIERITYMTDPCLWMRMKVLDGRCRPITDVNAWPGQALTAY